MTHHLGRLWPTDRKLEISILLPETEEKRESRQQVVKRFSRRSDGLRVRIAVQTTLLRLRSFYEFAPGVNIIRLVALQ